MTTFNKKYFQELKENFRTVTKRIQPYESTRPLSKNQEKLKQYKKDLVKSFNDIILYLASFVQIANVEGRNTLDVTCLDYLEKFKKNLDTLRLKYTFSNDIYELIDIDSITSTEQETSGDNESETDAVSTIATSQENVTDSDEEFEDTSDISDTINKSMKDNTDDTNIDNQNAKYTNIKMPQTIPEFLKLASQLLNYKYKGDPLELDTFLADVSLVESICEDQNKPHLFTFIKARLGVKPMEYMPDNLQTVDQILEALRANIKPKTSKEVERDLLSLKMKDSEYDKFVKKTEELAEALKRSLIVEGITRAKALEMTISKTIDVCRANTRSTTAKSVIESASYTNASEVLSNFVIQNDKAKKEHDALELEKLKKNNAKTQNNNNRGNFRGGNRGNFRGRSGHNNNSNRNFGNQNRGRDNQNSQQNNRGNYRGGNFRGRGSYNNTNNRNEHTIRIVQGNDPVPSQGGSNQEQTIHIPFN